MVFRFFTLRFSFFPYLVSGGWYAQTGKSVFARTITIKISIMPSDRKSTDAKRVEEFLDLYSACQRSLYIYIVSLTGDPTDAHDVLQDTNLVLWEKFDQFERGTNFKAWAREIARYRVLRYRQIHANDAPIMDPGVIETLAQRIDETEPSEEERFAELLLGCVDRLCDADRELIRLRYQSGVQVKLLAAQLKRSANAVSQSLGRIRKLLRKCVEQEAERRERGEYNG